MIRLFLLTIAASLISLATYLYFHLGLYKTVEITTQERGPLPLLYQTHTGAYHQIGPTIEAVEKWATANNLKCTTTFGEYLDDPAIVDQDRLRSRGGCVLDKALDAAPDGFHFEERPSRQYVIGRFDGSPSAGPLKVYPQIKKYLDSNRMKSSSSVIELYFVGSASVVTEYLFAID